MSLKRNFIRGFSVTILFLTVGIFFNNCAGEGGFDAGLELADSQVNADGKPDPIRNPQEDPLTVPVPETPSTNPNPEVPVVEAPVVEVPVVEAPETDPVAEIPTKSGDPGLGKGLWMPPGMPNRIVADQSSSRMDVSYIPGCLNGQFAKDSSSGCAYNDYYSGRVFGTNSPYTVRLGDGRQLVLRYRTKPVVTDGRRIRVVAWNAGSVVVDMRVWLSTSPTATYEDVRSLCRAQSTGSPSIGTASQESVTTTKTVWGKAVTSTAHYCKLLPNTVYYFGIEFLERVSAHEARFQVDELAADFLK